jgi:hypothetical protein
MHDTRPKLIFAFFWHKFEKMDNIFSFLINDLNSFDIYVLHSVFGPSRRLNPTLRFLHRLWWRSFSKIKKKRVFFIWYTGEAIEPPQGYDLTLSFAQSSHTNIYWPLWATYLQVLKMDKLYDREYTYRIEDLLEVRNCPGIGNMRVCVFMSDADSWRIPYAMALKEAGLADLYGTAFGNSVEKKSVIAKEYTFQLAFENRVIDGYVTEKPIEAWLDGTIPIYAGLDTQNYLNQEALVNVTGLKPEEVVSQVNKLLDDRIKLKSMKSMPILQRSFNFRELINVTNKCNKNRIDS